MKAVKNGVASTTQRAQWCIVRKPPTLVECLGYDWATHCRCSRCCSKEPGKRGPPEVNVMPPSVLLLFHEVKVKSISNSNDQLL